MIMPYQNEHAARLRDPDQYDRIRRVNDEFGDGVDAIYGITDDSAELQAIRFDSDKYSVSQAREWLNENDYNPIEFEPAEGSSDNTASDLFMPLKNYQYPGTIEIEAFRAGTHTDSAGNTHTWSEDDVQAIADQYNVSVSSDNPNRREAPVVVGHPKDNSPAFGWIQSAKKVKDKLVLTLSQLNEDFVKALREGAYKYRSISLFPDNTIRHIGFLGGAQPAVPGLGPINWSTTDDDVMTFEFSADETPVSVEEDITEIERQNNFFKRLFERFKIDVSSLETSDHTEDKGMPEKTDMEKLTQQIAELNEKITERDQTISDLNKRISESDSKNRKAEYKAFCDGLVAEGKMLPKQVDMHVENMELRYHIDAQNFSDGNSETKSLDAYKKFLSESEVIADFSETATKDKATEKAVNDFDTAVKRIVDTGKSYSEAYNLAAQQNPELYKEYLAG